jgi:sugar (pentulose or hexulose) kinase
MTAAYLGIDLGTQGLSAILVDSSDPLTVIAVGEGPYGMTTSKAEQQQFGHYEQRPGDWLEALKCALQQIRTEHGIVLVAASGNGKGDDDDEETDESANKKLRTESATIGTTSTPQRRLIELLAIGVAGQMHGEVMLDEKGQVLGDTSRLWCDARNQEQADILMSLFSGVSGSPIKIPKRMTVARYLWSSTHRSSLQEQCRALTTPAGYVVHQLTGGQNHTIGIGEGSGMFPICPRTKNWRHDLLSAFDEQYSTSSGHSSLSKVLPTVLVAGQVAGVTASSESWWLNDLLPPGVPIAPAEGDQPASLVAGLMAQRGQITCSFGISVVANVIGGGDDSRNSEDTAVVHTTPSVDHFMTVTGQETYMVCLRNGTTWLNHLVETQYGKNWEKLMPQLLSAPDDCDGLLSLPFLDDEPALDVKEGGTAMVIGHRSGAGNNGGGDEDSSDGKKLEMQNTLIGSTLKSSLLATMFNLKLGTSPLLEQLSNKKGALSISEGVVLTGGLTKTPETGQILANVFNTTVRVPKGVVGQEGCSWGAALLAMYTHDQSKRGHDHHIYSNEDFVSFLARIEDLALDQYHYKPQPNSVQTLESVLKRYEDLLKLQPSLQKVVQKSK